MTPPKGPEEEHEMPGGAGPEGERELPRATGPGGEPGVADLLSEGGAAAPAAKNGAQNGGRRADLGHEGGLGVRDQIRRYRSAFLAVVAIIVIAAGSARLHPRPRAPHAAYVVPGARPRTFHAEGRIRNRPGGYAGPGPDGHDRRREDRRNRERRTA